MKQKICRIPEESFLLQAVPSSRYTWARRKFNLKGNGLRKQNNVELQEIWI